MKFFCARKVKDSAQIILWCFHKLQDFIYTDCLNLNKVEWGLSKQYLQASQAYFTTQVEPWYLGTYRDTKNMTENMIETEGRLRGKENIAPTFGFKNLKSDIFERKQILNKYLN